MDNAPAWVDAVAMHELRRFIEAEMDARSWDRPALQRASGLSRSHVHKLLSDTRESLGRMPDEQTLQGLAAAFGSYDKVRAAAARSLSRFSDDGAPLTVSLREVSADALLAEIRRRMEEGRDVVETSPESDAQAQGGQVEEAGGLLDEPEPRTTFGGHEQRLRDKVKDADDGAEQGA